jgi:hypothetical protein
MINSNAGPSGVPFCVPEAMHHITDATIANRAKPPRAGLPFFGVGEVVGAGTACATGPGPSAPVLKSRPQCLQTMASTLISSAQYGHFLVSAEPGWLAISCSPFLPAKHDQRG